MVTHANNATLMAAVAVAIGSLGTWGTVIGIDVSGLNGDGKITLTLAACAGLAALAPAFSQRAALRFAATMAGLVAAATGWRFIFTTANEPFISTGWGIWLVALGGTALTATPWIGARAQHADSDSASGLE